MADDVAQTLSASTISATHSTAIRCSRWNTRSTCFQAKREAHPEACLSRGAALS